MSEYRAPLREMQFLIDELAGKREAEGLPARDGLNADLVGSVLSEAARWAEEVLVPLYPLGDREIPELRDGHVCIAQDVKSAFSQFVEGGWCSLAFEKEWGGQNLPELVSVPVGEIWKSANLAFSNCPLLTSAAASALRDHGGEELKARFLRQLVSGECTGTMSLTEPQAGSDLSALRATAVPDGDYYRLRGKKIFITWGDHDLTDNILHFVLARTPESPPGIKGISLFLVPKRIPAQDGKTMVSNDITTVSIERKLGIHASPTCALSYGDTCGSVAYLVGEENEGLVYMFTMMNKSRLSVGVDGIALSERAYQKALAYARDRVQGNPPGHTEPGPILYHPDVRRMLMLMRSCNEAMRALAYCAAFVSDVARGSRDQETRERAVVRLSVLTPIIKAWCSELGQEMVSLGLQVHGGLGYIEETGVAQLLRDVRITSIYEGTTGIQARDLIGRKLIDDGGQGIRALFDEIEALDRPLEGAGEPLSRIRGALTRGLAAAVEAADYILTGYKEDEALPGAVSVNFLMLMGTLLGGWQLAVFGLTALRRLDGTSGEDQLYLAARLGRSRFYAEHLMPRIMAYHASIMAGSASITALSDAQLAL